MGLAGAPVEPLLWAGGLLAEGNLATMASGEHHTISRETVVSNEIHQRKPKHQPPKHTETQHRCYMPLSKGRQLAPVKSQESSADH